ncbi:kelch-like protein 17 isoform X1 [Zeugodacus cucurbitae]|uniref:kelch-like protein 17 isoform X1 n=1 Tax=Zeugodacus cucurbitae TaxID=28588 RepID=UPI0023D90AFA|nr:kelch-like protein 17 isoform X1 [Zeugodacus cucurbitae]XP_054087954.1 kelch-like protein 17 isoform X1 [Zeugodacus cucurbitae]
MATSSKQATASQRNLNELKLHFMEKLMKKIFCFYDEQSLIDVTFKVSNPEAFIPAHRLILSAASPYFENLFNGDRGNAHVIEINDIDSDIFERLITFCYTGKALFTVNNVAATLKAAIVLQLEDAATICMDFIMSHIDECTLQGVYALERETQCELVKRKIHEYEIQNFLEISQRDEFLNFDVEKLQCLLKSDNLNITCEEDAYGAITRWYNHDVSARQEHLPRLVACLRLTQFDVDFLLTHIQSLPGCELLALQASTWISNPSARTKINMRFTEPRVGIGAGNCDEKTLLLVYEEHNSSKACALQYNKAEDTWQKYATLYNYNINSSAILKDDNLLFIGGDSYKSPSKSFLSWNIPNKTWRKLSKMNHRRQDHSVVELEGKIYAIGGRGENDTILQSVERYTASNGWEFVAPLITARCEAGAVSLNGKVYIIGGSNGKTLKSVECYNPDSNSWTYCAVMREEYPSLSVAAHNGDIYVVGYFKGMPAVERYDPYRDTWTQICSLDGKLNLTTKRPYVLSGNWYGFACASLDNELWAIGSSMNNETTVEVYNEENDHWVQKRPLPKGFIYSCFVIPVTFLTSK